MTLNYSPPILHASEPSYDDKLTEEQVVPIRNSSGGNISSGDGN